MKRRRLEEAIKQTEIVLEDIDHPETRDALENALAALRQGLQSLAD